MLLTHCPLLNIVDLFSLISVGRLKKALRNTVFFSCFARGVSFAHNQSEMVAGHGNASVPQKTGDMLEAAKIVTPCTIQQRIVVQTEMATDVVDGPKIMSSDTVHRTNR